MQRPCQGPKASRGGEESIPALLVKLQVPRGTPYTLPSSRDHRRVRGGELCPKARGLHIAWFELAAKNRKNGRSSGTPLLGPRRLAVPVHRPQPGRCPPRHLIHPQRGPAAAVHEVGHRGHELAGGLRHAEVPPACGGVEQLDPRRVARPAPDEGLVLIRFAQPGWHPVGSVGVADPQDLSVPAVLNEVGVRGLQLAARLAPAEVEPALRILEEPPPHLGQEVALRDLDPGARAGLRSCFQLCRGPWRAKEAVDPDRLSCGPPLKVWVARPHVPCVLHSAVVRPFAGLVEDLRPQALPPLHLR
mmetsp:Transcript_1944/g.6436  ORF Transcript_1944/g.6436 Transcript_1944/m.6436 type:complete len:303 (+) Transcript_1944:2-910(+)